MEDEATIQLIQATIDKVRPFLQRDGGDIDYIGFRDGIVYVTMVGACQGCSLAQDDISSGVEIILMEEVPGVMAVRTEGVPEDLMTDYIRRKNEAALEAAK
ncbi:MAG: NifU family protein [Mollicutes bacterium]|nr:NifU family protein [bacterium]MDD6801535.1 NifU family protein [Mollicutes bacterium]MDD7064675.1 NifU family protein [Mollicutes bacterium]